VFPTERNAGLASSIADCTYAETPVSDAGSGSWMARTMTVRDMRHNAFTNEDG
jgi:hypothetical protein